MVKAEEEESSEQQQENQQQSPPKSEADRVTLSTVELQVLSELDSTHFGFLRLTDDEHSRKKELVCKAIRYLEKFIVQSLERQRAAHDSNNNNGQTKTNPAKFQVDPKIYCKIGHLHLLLEDYSKALEHDPESLRLVRNLLHPPAQ